MTIEQFKIRFDHLAKTAKGIADYYKSADNPQDYTTWFQTYQGFLEGIVKFDLIRRDIKAIKANPTQEDLDKITNNIDDVVRILDSSIDFLLKDVLDIGPLGEEKLIQLAVNQSLQFEVNGEIHNLTVKSIKPDGEVEFVVQSEPQEVELVSGEEKNLTVATTSTEADTSLKVSRVEKNIVYVSIKSTSLRGLVPVKKEIGCLDVTSNLDLNSTDVKCFNILADNIILDGKRKKIDGGGLLYGIAAEGRSGITIKNFVLTNFVSGVKLVDVKDSIITNMEITAVNGIELKDSSDNQIRDNKIILVKVGGIGKAAAEENIVGEAVVLGDIVLDSLENGEFEPLLSMTNNLDPSDFKDVKGNTLTTLDFIIETIMGNDVIKLEEPISFKKGQTKLVRSGLKISLNEDTEAEIKVNVSGGSVSTIFTKKVSLRNN